ncbi:hypothetical protein BH24BAC1_BH24BAC1_08620 [soil metagenome]
MVCPRCIKVVREDLEKLGLEVMQVELGEAVVKTPKGVIDLAAIRETLQSEGFALLEDKLAVVVEKIKAATILLIYSGDLENRTVRFSEYISEAVGKDYHTISTVFSSAEHVTIEKYCILQKVERAKELFSDREQSFNEIARKLGYSSSAHFSNQFKQITGQSPTEFRKNPSSPRKSIDQIM